jgi:quercetin dioxygenase-like cupin family protein
VLPVDLKPPVFWHIDRFDTPEAARNSVGPTSVAFEGAGRTWLLSIEADTGTHHGGHHVAHVGPLKLSHAGRYALQVQVAAFTPGMFSVVHHHSGVEAIYVVEGEACYETASRAFRLRKGGTLAIDAGVLHRAVVPGSTLRYVIAVIVHDASQPPTTRMADHMQTQLVSCR